MSNEHCSTIRVKIVDFRPEAGLLREGEGRQAAHPGGDAERHRPSQQRLRRRPLLPAPLACARRALDRTAGPVLHLAAPPGRLRQRARECVQASSRPALSPCLQP